MKVLHLHFHFHINDWLTHHLVLMHCQAKSQSFTTLGEDPDHQIYKAYLANQVWDEMKGASQALKKCQIEPPNCLVLPWPKVSVLVLHCQWANILGS